LAQESQQQASSGEPIVIGEQHEKPSVFQFEPVHGSIDLLSRYESDTTDQGNFHQHTDEALFQESLTVQTQGSIYHPNIFAFNIGLTGGLEQQFFDDNNPNTDNHTNDFLYGWDINGTLLRNEIAPLTLYTRRFEQFVERDFSPSQQTTTTTYGSTLDIRAPLMPTTIQLYHMGEVVDTLVPGEGYTLDQNVAQVHSDGTPAAHQHLGLDLGFTNTFQTNDVGPSITLNTFDASASHNLTFGKDDASSLSSTLNYTDQRGQIPFTRLRLDENLRLKHSEQFETRYDYTFDEERFQGSDQTSNRLSAGFIHHLFESLTTSGNVAGVNTDLENGGSIQQLLTNLSLDYRKNAPLGILFGNLTLGYSSTRTDLNGTPVQIFNESQTFNDSLPIVLTRPLIDPATVIVKDTSGVPFTRGLDYTVAQQGTRTVIQRNFSGRIPPDSPVLLDYTVLPVPANTTDTATFGAGLRYDFTQSFLKGLSPYARYLHQDQEVHSQEPGQVPIDDIRAVIVGADYRVWRLTFNAEHEWHHSTLLPFEAGRYSARYDDQLTNNLSVTLAGAFSQTHYTDPDNQVNTATASAVADWRLSQRWSLLGRVMYLNDDDHLIGHTRGLEETLELRWKYRQTEVFSRVRNSDLTSDQTDQNFQTFELGFRRMF
jgi:hypothetical protein